MVSDLCVPCNVRQISHCRTQCSHCCLPKAKAHVSPFTEFSSYMGDLKYSSCLPISLTYIVLFPWSPLLAMHHQAWVFFFHSHGGIGHLPPAICSLSWFWLVFPLLGSQHGNPVCLCLLTTGDPAQIRGFHVTQFAHCVVQTAQPTVWEPFAFLIDQILGMQRNKYGSLPDLISERMDSWP